MHLGGIHHLTAVTADAARNHAFYTRVLGLRLVKKTVNQDDVSAYHLFYADGRGSPGSDLTFFDWRVPREERGTRSITRTGLRVADEASLRWWLERFEQLDVAHGRIEVRDKHPVLDFEDAEGQRFTLVVDLCPGDVHPWERSPVPAEHQIYGLGPVTLSVPSLQATEHVLTDVMNFRRVREYHASDSRISVLEMTKIAPAERQVHVFEMGAGGPAAELHVMVEPDLEPARPGAGGVHHVAFRTPNNEEYTGWVERLASFGIRSSGPVDRYYFRSLYFREPGGILFEIATDGPGFAVDEPMDTLGEQLALPPFLEKRRKEIEAGLKPIEIIA